jgi:glycerol-3-phosphate cytidylyltransferase
MRVGFTCSTFDLFHAGHVMMLKEAKTQCDHLIVGLQIDPTLDRPGVKNKPIQSVLERFIQVQACKFVDEIIPYATEKELMDILTSYPIDVRIIGEEYRDKQFTGFNLPISVYFNSRQHSFSTTELRQRVLDIEKAK